MAAIILWCSGMLQLVKAHPLCVNCWLLRLLVTVNCCVHKYYFLAWASPALLNANVECLPTSFSPIAMIDMVYKLSTKTVPYWKKVPSHNCFSLPLNLKVVHPHLNIKHSILCDSEISYTVYKLLAKTVSYQKKEPSRNCSNQKSDTTTISLKPRETNLHHCQPW